MSNNFASCVALGACIASSSALASQTRCQKGPDHAVRVVDARVVKKSILEKPLPLDASWLQPIVRVALCYRHLTTIQPMNWLLRACAQSTLPANEESARGRRPARWPEPTPNPRFGQSLTR